MRIEDWIDWARTVVAECSFPEYKLQVAVSRTGFVYLQAHYDEVDTVTGVVEPQYTRRWLLAPEMTKSEIVATAFKCVLTSMEHKTREWFLYRGRAVYQPHQDVDKLWETCRQSDERLRNAEYEDYADFSPKSGAPAIASRYHIAAWEPVGCGGTPSLCQICGRADDLYHGDEWEGREAAMQCGVFDDDELATKNCGGLL